MLKKLKRKFVAITMAMVTVMLCVILGLVLFFTYRSLEQESYQKLQNAGTVDFRPGRPGGRGDRDTFTLMLGSGGEMLAAGSTYFDLSDPEYLLELAEEVLEEKQDVGKLPEYGLIYRREKTPAGVRLSFADISREKEVMRNLTVTCGIIGIASLLGFFCLSLLLARWAVRPVERAWQQQRQFVADASHELKTPLTVITTNAELLLQPERSGEERQRFSENILTMSRQMRGLVEGMLELARGDNGALKMNFAPVNLSALVEDCCLGFDPVAYEQGRMLDREITPDLTCSGSESHLRQVVEILLDNAVKYSRGPGAIRVALTVQGNDYRLTVENPGPEISQEDLERIFGRFYRIDKARTGGSFGLGLPIARSLVTAHAGKIWAESENGTVRFAVQLPKQ